MLESLPTPVPLRMLTIRDYIVERSGVQISATAMSVMLFNERRSFRSSTRDVERVYIVPALGFNGDPIRGFCCLSSWPLWTRLISESMRPVAIVRSSYALTGRQLLAWSAEDIKNAKTCATRLEARLRRAQQLFGSSFLSRSKSKG